MITGGLLRIVFVLDFLIFLRFCNFFLLIFTRLFTELENLKFCQKIQF